MMTVRDLLKKLEGVDPTARIVTEAGDHSYRDATVGVATALDHPDAGWTEDHGEQLTPEAEYGKRLPVVIVR